jgi:hypothetical protein
MGKEMSNSEFDLLRCILKKMSQGRSLTRELVADCYYSSAPKGSTEKKSVSEKWIDFFTDRLRTIPHDELLAAQHGRGKMGDLLHKLLT